MFSDLSGCAAEERTGAQASASRHRSAAHVELITTAALAVSTAVAITAVSIGMARANVASAIIKEQTMPLAVAVLVSLLLTGMGGLTAILAERRRRK